MSELVGAVVTALPAGARVVVPDVEFTSTLFPFLIQSRLEVSTVQVAEVADAVAEGTDAVAFSSVQMSTGEVADTEAILDAASAVNAVTICDATQALGWLPTDASRLDALVCHAYKWLMSPRGTAFMHLDPGLAERVVPNDAGWFAAEDVFGTYYGGPLRLAASARRFDTSPAWFNWVATAPAIELVNRIGVGAIHEHDVRLANRFREGLGLPPAGSAIVSADSPNAEEAFARAGILASARAGRLRVSFHVYNTDADVDTALNALA